MLNKQKGNMYGFVTHTSNPIKGICLHDCNYCFMKRFGNLKPIRLVERELEVDIGTGKVIFVGSSTDMFANNIPSEWIMKVLKHCQNYDNTYLFQTKNPKRFHEFKDYFPTKTILCITLETNYIDTKSKNAPSTYSRKAQFENLDWHEDSKMVTIEPIMEFKIDIMVKWIKDINPFQVNIGADSQHHNLPEPNAEKIQQLIKKLERFTNVNLKPNLKRLYKVKPNFPQD